MSDNTSLPQLVFNRQTPHGPIADLEVSAQMQDMVHEAELMKIAWEIIPFTSIIKLTYNNHTEYSKNGMASTNRVPGPYICDDKYLTRMMLIAANLPVTKGFVIKTADSKVAREHVFEALTKPLVIKPAYGTHGLGVKTGVDSLEKMNQWIDHLFKTEEQDTERRDGMVLVEETAVGTEYRIIATTDRVVAVMNRQPASVTGDGIHSIKQLIAQKNTDPLRNIHQALYPHIQIDADMIEVLSKTGLSVDTIPAQDQKVILRTVSNIMAGGDAVDVTDDIHPSVADLAIKTCQAIPGMTLVGLDYITTDITADQKTETSAIIEVNRSPGYTMHDFPMIGTKRGVARAILQMMFPEWKE